MKSSRSVSSFLVVRQWRSQWDSQQLLNLSGWKTQCEDSSQSGALQEASVTARWESCRGARWCELHLDVCFRRRTQLTQPPHFRLWRQKACKYLELHSGAREAYSKCQGAYFVEQPLTCSPLNCGRTSFCLSVLAGFHSDRAEDSSSSAGAFYYSHGLRTSTVHIFPVWIICDHVWSCTAGGIHPMLVQRSPGVHVSSSRFSGLLLILWDEHLQTQCW